jgi:pimeloyl-ACP methyl ester carboxylesterase
MKERIKHNGQDIYFQLYGGRENPAIFFLHGYLESSEVWNGFADSFAEKFFVICIDLPGHGDSEAHNETQTMGDMAYAVKAVADALKIQKLHLIGHSMGGYVTMAFRDKFPDMLLSFVLFHSHCFADSEEKRTARDREIELILQGKKSMIINAAIPRTFADSNLDKMSTEVEHIKQIALRTTENGIICALKGMKLRADRCLLLMAGGIPLLIIAGRKDNHIPYNTYIRMKNMAKSATMITLDKSGHMGFIEEKEKAQTELKKFLETNSF